MSFFISGASHKNCPVELREKLHVADDKLIPALQFAIKQPGVAECVILSTCNRVEFYGEAENLNAWMTFLNDYWTKERGFQPELLKSFYHHQGNEMVKHLFHVSS